MTDQWNEPLHCPTCRSTGSASLFQDDQDTPSVRRLAEGFKVVQTQYGPTFYCAKCDVSTDIG